MHFLLIVIENPAFQFIYIDLNYNYMQVVFISIKYVTEV